MPHAMCRLHVVVGVLILTSTGCTDDGAPRVAAAPSPSGTVVAEPGPTPTSQATESVDRATTSVFSSPTGNLACSLSAVQAVCEIAVRTYSPPPPPADCDLDHGGMLAVGTSGPGRFLCHGDTAFAQATASASGGRLVAPGRALAYGESITNGAFLCTSRENGMTCETADGAHGFELAQARYRVY